MKLKNLKESWNVKKIKVEKLSGDMACWTIYDKSGKSFEPNPKYCNSKLPPKKSFFSKHQVEIDRIGDFVIGLTLNGKQIYFLKESEYCEPLKKYIAERDTELNKLLEQIDTENIGNDIQKLAGILKTREEILHIFLPKVYYWKSRLALELIICKAITSICNNHTFNMVAKAEIFDEKIIAEELYKAGFPKGNYGKVWEVFLLEARCFLIFYVKDTLLMSSIENSQILSYNNCFMQTEISKKVLIKYLNYKNIK